MPLALRLISVNWSKYMAVARKVRSVIVQQSVGTEVKKVSGNPDSEHISTSFVERQNLTMRMNMRRFTRLTNAFSKKVENLACAVALHFSHYNFCRVHQTLRVTPAMEAGVTDHVWGIEEIIYLCHNSPCKNPKEEK